MSFFGAVRVLVVARPGRRASAADDEPAEIAVGAWAAWAASVPASRVRSPSRAAFGDACRTRVGREGRLVEIAEGDRSWLVCQET